MSKERYEQWGYESFKDNKTGEIYDNYIDLLNQQNQRIEELEGQFAYECECNKQFMECQKENEELKQQLKNAIVPKFKIGQEVWCVYEYWWNGKLADEPNKFAINNFIINAINIDKYGKHYIFHKKYEGRDLMICYQPNNFNGNRFNVISGVQNHCTDYYYLFATKEEALAKLEELQGE